MERAAAERLASSAVGGARPSEGAGVGVRAAARPTPPPPSRARLALSRLQCVVLNACHSLDVGRALLRAAPRVVVVCCTPRETRALTTAPPPRSLASCLNFCGALLAASLPPCWPAGLLARSASERRRVCPSPSTFLPTLQGRRSPRTRPRVLSSSASLPSSPPSTSASARRCCRCRGRRRPTAPTARPGSWACAGPLRLVVRPSRARAFALETLRPTSTHHTTSIGGVRSLQRAGAACRRCRGGSCCSTPRRGGAAERSRRSTDVTPSAEMSVPGRGGGVCSSSARGLRRRRIGGLPMRWCVICTGHTCGSTRATAPQIWPPWPVAPSPTAAPSDASARAARSLRLRCSILRWGSPRRWRSLAASDARTCVPPARAATAQWRSRHEDERCRAEHARTLPPAPRREVLSRRTRVGRSA